MTPIIVGTGGPFLDLSDLADRRENAYREKLECQHDPHLGTAYHMVYIWLYDYQMVSIPNWSVSCGYWLHARLDPCGALNLVCVSVENLWEYEVFQVTMYSQEAVTTDLWHHDNSAGMNISVTTINLWCQRDWIGKNSKFCYHVTVVVIVFVTIYLWQYKNCTENNP